MAKWCAVASALVIALPSSAGLIFHDPLKGGTSGTNNNITIGPTHALMTHADSWVQYPSPDIPGVQGTISCWVRIFPGCTGSLLVSNARLEAGTGYTWPDFTIYVEYDQAAGTYRTHLGYWNSVGPPYWRRLYGPSELVPGKWYHMGYTWGPQGMEIWTDGLRRAYDPSITDTHDIPPDHTLVAWGLGRFYTHGADLDSTWRMGVRDLRMYDTQEPYGGTNSAPVLWWHGGPGYVGDAVQPDCAEHRSLLRFKIRYVDREGQPPAGGVLMHLRRNGVDVARSPFALNNPAANVYGLTRRLPWGDYAYRLEASDGLLPAIGAPTRWRQGPEIITPPRLSHAMVIPAVGDSTTRFQYLVDYTTLDGKDARWVELQILRYDPAAGWKRFRFRKRGIAPGTSVAWKLALSNVFPGATRFKYRFRACKGVPPCRLTTVTDWTRGPRLTDGGSQALALSSLSAAPTRAGGAQIVFALSAPGTVSARVLNMAGRPVRALAPITGQQGLNTLVWDGRSDAGLAAPGGQYVIEVTARSEEGGQARALAPLALLR